jgi:N12 class adenine-specific DNA methylase
VRDAVRECLRTQLEDRDDSDVELARAQLNQRYDWFVSRYGPLSDRTNASGVSGRSRICRCSCRWKTMIRN